MRFLRFTAVMCLMLSAFCGPAAAIDFLDRLVGYAEHTIAPTDADGAPLRIGLMLPSDGEFSEPATRLRRGWTTAVRLSDGIVADRRVVIVPGDTGSTAMAAVESAIDLMRGTPVDIFAGVISARVARAMSIFADKANRPMVLAGAIGEDVMAGACSSRVARTSFNIGPYQQASAKFLAKQYGTAVTLAPDAPGGHRLIKRFTRLYRAAGGKIVEQLWAPTGRKYDWSSWLTRSAANGPQMIYAVFEGRNAQRLIYRHSSSGLKEHVTLAGPEWLFGPRTLNLRGRHAAGMKFLTSHFPDLDTPGNRIFVDAYRKAYGEDPDLYAYLGYENALAVLLTTSALDGKTDDAQKFIATLKSLDYTGLMPRGAYRFNRSNSAVLTRLYWVGIEHTDGKTTLRKLTHIPVPADNSACKLSTARATR